MNTLFNNAEELLKNNPSPELEAVLNDYILEKKFMAISQDLSEHPALKEIAEDRDAWEKKHYAAFTSYYKPEMEYSDFRTVSFYSSWTDNSLPVDMTFSWEDHYCGNTDYYSRTLPIFKQWLFPVEGAKPWISYWNQELIKEVREDFFKVVVPVFQGSESILFGSMIGVSQNFFDGSEEQIMKKLHRFQNLICFVQKAQKQNISNLYEKFYNYRIETDSSDPEDGSTSLMNFITSLDGFDPLAIEKLVKEMLAEQKAEDKKREEELKQKEFEDLSQKLSNVDFNEIEQLLKLKKELNK